MSAGPILRVSRPVSACKRCQKSKTKCDGKLPICSPCEKVGKANECLSTDENFVRGSERSYPTFLESKRARLCRKLAEAQRSQGIAFSPPFPNPESDPSGSLQPTGAGSSPLNNRKEANEVDKLVSSFGSLAVGAAARDYQGFTQVMSIARVTLWAAEREAVIDYGHGAALPTREDAILLGKQYLGSLFTILPVIEESSFWASLQAVYDPSPMIASPFNHWIVRLVFANALIVQSKQFEDNHYRLARQHVTAALAHAESVLRPDSTSNLQAMLLFVEYARYDPRRFDNWYLSGAVSRAMVDLGLHQDPSKSSKISKAQLEARRRIFLCVYTSDRQMSINLSRAFSFSDASTNVDVKALTDEPRAEARIWMRSYDFGYRHYRIRRIQSEIFQDLHQSTRTPWLTPDDYVWRQWHVIQEWFEDFPPLTDQKVQYLAAVERVASHILLLAPSAATPEISELAQSLLFEYCIEYATKVRDALQGDVNIVWLPYPSAMRAMKMADIFISNFVKNQDRILQGERPLATGAAQSESSVPPPFPYPRRKNNNERAMVFCTAMSEILRIFGNRLGLWDLQGEFRSKSEPLKDACI